MYRISDVIGVDSTYIETGDAARIVSVLGQRSYNNIVYSGRSGVGKTATISGIVQAQMVDPADAKMQLPLHMVNKTFWMMNISEVFLGEEEVIRSNLKKMISTLSGPGQHVLVVEDANDLLEAITDHGIPGVISILLHELHRKSFQCILMVREESGSNTKLNSVLGCHSDMEELFTIIEKKPPSKDIVHQIVAAYKPVIEQHHPGLSITDDAVTEVVNLTHTYPSLSIYLREQPARSLRFLDLIASRYILHQTNQQVVHSEWATAVRKLQELNNEANGIEQIRMDNETTFNEESGALREALFEEFGEQPDQFSFNTRKTLSMKECEQTIAACDVDLKAILPEIKQITRGVNIDLELDKSAVCAEFSELSGIPSGDLDDTESQKMLHLEQRMLDLIYGQDYAVQVVSGSIKRSSVLKTKNKPIGSFILLGSSGVGKTYLGEVLAQVLFDNKDNMTVFDMSEFMEKHTVSRLIGAPPGYAGYGSGGALTNTVRKRPHQVILLDEVEKAHPDVFKILFQVLDKGRLSDELGTVDFSNVIILMTTNLAEHLSLEDDVRVDDTTTREAIITELKTIFPQALINRIDDFLLFKALLAEHIANIVYREIGKMNTTLEAVNFSLNLSNDDVMSLVADRYNREEGSRQVLKFIGNTLEPMIADIVLNNPKGGVLTARYNSEDHTFQLSLQD